jgi:hypothetical protein
MTLHRNVAAQDARLAELEAINRQRDLTQAECAELDRLHRAAQFRRYRAPAQLAAARKRVARLEAMLR